MKTITLKTFSTPLGGALGYSDILKMVINTPLNRERGFDANDMRTTIKIMDKIDAANGTLELEDTEHVALKQKLDAFPFAMAHRDLLDLIDEVG